MGVLAGMKVVEMVGLGPGPFCGMLLADLGADVIAVERPAPGAGKPRPWAVCSRGKRSIILDLKKPGGVDTFLQLLDGADALIEGMRPGVMERLGVGPDVCLARRPSLVFGRMTGWGQHGPLAKAAGHDANYVALSGALWLATQPGQRPEAPPGLLGDVAGGALYLAIGILAAVLRARQDGRGQVVDAAMVDGSAHMLNLLVTFLPDLGGAFENGRPADHEKHWDRTYLCSDGEWIVVQSDEPHFYAELIQRLGLGQEERFVNGQRDRSKWRSLSEEMAALFKTRTRREWCQILEGTDACFASVLAPYDAATHPHIAAREIYKTIDGVLQATPAPRFSATPSSELVSVPARGAHTLDVLSQLEISSSRMKELRNRGALGTTV